MPLSSTTGLLIALMVLVPGGIGDVLMRKLTRMPRPHSDFRQVLSAVVWSVAALVLVELINSAATAAAFGDYLIVPAGDVGSSQAAVSLAGRYLVFTAVAVTLPAAARGLGCFVIEHFTRRTLDEPTIDRLRRLMPKGGKPWHYARIQLEDELVEGFVE